MRVFARCGMAGLLFLLAVAALPQDAGALLGQLKSDNGETRREAVGKIGALGAEVVGPLFDLMGGENQTLDLNARQAAELVAYHAAPGAARRAAVSEALAREADSKRPRAVRELALRMLSLVGGDEALPTLSKLLADPEVGELARATLARIPGPRATKALKEALATANPERKVGLVNALASRHELALLSTFTTALEDKDEAVRIAALYGLASIPDGAASPPLEEALATGSPGVKREASRALLRLAQNLAADGKKLLARRIYFQCAGLTDVTLRTAALAGLGQIDNPDVAAFLLTSLRDPSSVARGAARQALIDLKAPNATTAIAAAVPAADAPTRALLVGVLGERRDAAAKETLLRALADKDEAVRIAACRALGTLADPTTVSALVGAVGGAPSREPKTSDAEWDALEWALSRLPGAEATKTIGQALVCQSARVGAVLAHALGNRGDRAATQDLLSIGLHEPEEAERVATIEALGRLRSPEATKPLLEKLGKPDSAETKAAEAALAGFTSPEATQVMVEALAHSPDPVRAGILRALAPREDHALLDAFLAAAKDKSEEVVVAAVEALSRLRDEKAAPVFLEIAQSGSDRAKQAAVKAYLGIAEARAGRDGAAALSIYQRALEIATGDDEKRAAILGIGRVGDVPQLALIEPYFDNAALRPAAAEAALPLADKLVQAGQKDRAIELYRRVAAAGTGRDVLRAASQKLRALGVDLHLAASKGCVVNWWVLGPIPGRERATKTDVLATDRPVDTAVPVPVDDKQLKWKYVVVDDPLGLLDFEQTVARQDLCGAYAYAEVKSDRDQDVLLKIGSDDSVFVWLNGGKVHAWDGNRGWAEDQDTVQAHLKPGTNTILAKVINGYAQWSLSLRVTDRDGKPLVLEQRKP